MRIFIHNCDCYIGKVLVKELRKLDDQFNRLFGTSSSGPENAPKAVKRIISREDPKRAKKMEETIQSCGLVVLDLFSCSEEDLHFAIQALKVDPTTNPPKPTGELDKEVIFVLISSVMVWANTKPESEDGILHDKDFASRVPVPGSKFELWKEYEDLVLNSFNREGSTVKGLIVAGGVIYGEGEGTLYPVFKDAWRGVQEHVILAPGTNRIPTVHVRDLARLVRQVSFSGQELPPEQPPYLLAIDQPPCGEDEKSIPSTQSEIVHSIINEVGDSYDVPMIDLAQTPEGMTDRLKRALSLNLKMEPSLPMKDPEFASQCEPPGLFCKEGLVHNARLMAGEFCIEWKLQPMRVLVAGPPASGKTTLAQAIAEHFRIPYIGALPDADAVSSRLASRACHYRGYVLDAGSMGYQEVERLFRYDAEPDEDEEEEEVPIGEDGEEGEAPKRHTRKLNEALCPMHVVVAEAEEEMCRARWEARRTGTVEEFEEAMQRYSAANLSEEDSLTDFFQDIAKLGVLALPVDGKEQEELLESTRIYIERVGRPFNFLPSEQEVAAQILARQTKTEEALEEHVAEEQRHSDDGAEESERIEEERNKERLRILAEHEEERRQMSELPFREYLMRYAVPTLTEGLIEMCKVLPEDPIDYLATYIDNHAADKHEEH